MQYWCLLFCLRKRLALARLEYPPPDVLEVSGERYTKTPPLNWSGLYDWLRSPDGRFLGVCLWPFDDVKYICAVGRLFPYAVDWKGHSLEVYLGGNRTWEAKMSDEGELLVSTIYVSDGGGVALAFEASKLTEADMATAHAAPDVDWVDALPMPAGH